MKSYFPKLATIIFGLLFFMMQCAQRGATNFRELARNPNTAIVDVRTPEEFAAGHIGRSINIPLPVVLDAIVELEEYEHIIFVCRSGNRSGIARNLFIERGWENVYNGGAWDTFQRRYLR